MNLKEKSQDRLAQLQKRAAHMIGQGYALHTAANVLCISKSTIERWNSTLDFQREIEVIRSERRCRKI